MKITGKKMCIRSCRRGSRYEAAGSNRHQMAVFVAMIRRRQKREAARVAALETLSFAYISPLSALIPDQRDVSPPE